MPKMITEKMTIGEILKANPNAFKTLEQYGLACAGCHLNTLETLEQGAQGHGLSEDDIRSMTKALSASIN